jgi:hypothetical protein
MIMVIGALLALSPTSAAAQKNRESVLQIEVGDSIGLPLPDAKVEVFGFANGGIYWEWLPLGSEALPAGINLLRFSYPGYQSSTFSVPIREGGTVSLRVRLHPQRDTMPPKPNGMARAVHAIGLALDGHMKADIIGRRRVLEREVLDTQYVNRFGQLLNRARNTELTVVPVSGGSFRVFSRSGGGNRCATQVMINGDRRRLLPFEAFDQLYSTGDVEVIEIFPAGSSIPQSYLPPRMTCGLMIVWFRSP